MSTQIMNLLLAAMLVFTNLTDRLRKLLERIIIQHSPDRTIGGLA